MAKIFLSYSHVDEAYCDMLQKHLKALQHQGLIEPWRDRLIKAGDEFESEISQQLEEADIILLLVSSDFISSRYCYDIEMARAMERHEEKSARVIPVILRSCDWTDTPFGKLLAAPKDGKPIKSWPDIDEAFLDVVRQIKSALPKAEAPSPSNAMPVTTAYAPAVKTAVQPRSSNLVVRKEFTQADLDDFLEEAFAFMAKFFQNSLSELDERNAALSTRFKQIDANHFTAVVYRDGTPVSRCKITLGGMFGRSITFSYNDQPADNSSNESLSAEADDQRMFLKTIGMAFHLNRYDEFNGKKLTPEGGAELYWAMLMQNLQ